MKDYNGKALFVRGLPGDHNLIKSDNPRIKIINHLAVDELNFAMEESELVICRSGYTTIMDLVKLQKKAILIPTPGQTEQEYLAAHLLKQKMFFSVEQQMFSLNVAIKELQNFPFVIPMFDMEQYKKTVAAFCSQL